MEKFTPCKYPRTVIVALSNIEDRLYQLVVIMDRIANSTDNLVDRMADIEKQLCEIREDCCGKTGRS